jgi:hypothetical protein
MQVTGISAPPLSAALRTAIKSMLVFYLIAVVSVIFPLQVRNPGWVLALVNVLIQNAVIPLAALVFVLFLTTIAPDETKNRRLARLMASCSLPAALGFFLLIPLQLGVSAYIVNQGNQALTRDLSVLKDRYATVRKSVAGASNPSDLAPVRELLPQQLVQTLFTLPLPQARPRIEEALVRTERELGSARRGQQNQLLWQGITASIRNVISSLFLGLAFYSARFGKIGSSLFIGSTARINEDLKKSAPAK